MLDRSSSTFARRGFAAGLASLLAVTTLGCGPQFFSAKGNLASSGGGFGQWSASPALCKRDEFDGDSSKLATFMFAAPKNDDPDRNLHRDQAPNGPAELMIAKNGDGYVAQLMTMKEVNTGNPSDVFKNMQGIVLDSSSCKTLTFDRKEHSATMGEFHKPLSGELVMDCTKYGSHLTADIKFKACE